MCLPLITVVAARYIQAPCLRALLMSYSRRWQHSHVCSRLSQKPNSQKPEADMLASGFEGIVLALSLQTNAG